MAERSAAELTAATTQRARVQVMRDRARLPPSTEGYVRDVFEPPPDLSLPLDREATAPRQARAGIRRLIGDEVPEDFAEDAQLLTSELVTNAVMYAPTGCKVSAWFVPDTPALRVEVADTTNAAPQVRSNVPATQIGGRGLQLVAARSSEWGVRSNSFGKSVWFELRG